MGIETKVVEKVIEVPVERINYVDRVKYVDKVDDEKLKQVTQDYENLQKTIEEWQAKYAILKKREVREVEKIVEVPTEVIQYIDVPKEVLVVDEERVAEL